MSGTRQLHAALHDLLKLQRDAFTAEGPPTHAVRVDRLGRLARLLEVHGDAFAEAISRDFGTRSPIEILITETMLVQAAIRHATRHLSRWMKSRRIRVAPAYLPGRAMLMTQPLGVVGIISPWNYPLQLALSPLVGVLAAGNRAMIKPSELTPLFSAELARAVASAFSPAEVAVVTGDANVGKAFASLPFDHLLFTGSSAVGRDVAQAAAKNLTPVTLELGGKSPAIIDESCDLPSVIDRLAWGKLINAGQTCIAPDYVLVPRGQVDHFVRTLQGSISRLYPTFRANPDYTSIVSERHLQRLQEIVEDARTHGAQVVELEAPTAPTMPAHVGAPTIVPAAPAHVAEPVTAAATHAAATHAAAPTTATLTPTAVASAPGSAHAAATSRQLAPTLLLDVTPDMRAMREEIFGPILPIVPYNTLSEAIAFVNRRERPLALYWFGTNRANRDRVLCETIAGGVSINDTLVHIAQDGLPFGGVGPSGQGHYHGELGFRQFSKQKPVFLQSRFSGGGVIRPPYKPSIRRVLRWLSHFI